jgi:hypothetical protein
MIGTSTIIIYHRTSMSKLLTIIEKGTEHWNTLPVHEWLTLASIDADTLLDFGSSSSM